ncbi:MAG: GNAT family N-acetyltransferase [Oscillospiraceae bacterium]|nr:GNAT family N-acetyltransferase [Oscillospiraceae bacterium]
MGQLKMIRPKVPLQQCDIPGYKIVSHDESLIDAWIEVSEELTRGRWTREQFIERMLGDPTVKPEAIFYVCDGDTPVGTATGQIVDGGANGRLHMVAVKAEYKGKGLGRLVCTAACEYLYSAGVSEISLATDDFRVPAVSLYLSMGFIPHLYEDDMPQRWENLYNLLKIEDRTVYDINKNKLWCKL